VSTASIILAGISAKAYLETLSIPKVIDERELSPFSAHRRSQNSRHPMIFFETKNDLNGLPDFERRPLRTFLLFERRCARNDKGGSQ